MKASREVRLFSLDEANQMLPRLSHIIEKMKAVYFQLMRIREDVLTQMPALVIWQTGVNDAVQDVGVETFQETLETGIRELKTAGDARAESASIAETQICRPSFDVQAQRS